MNYQFITVLYQLLSPLVSQHGVMYVYIKFVMKAGPWDVNFCGGSCQEMHARNWTLLSLAVWWRQTQVLLVGVLQINGKHG